MSAELVELLRDLSRPVPGIGFKRMFGGIGVFCDGLMFGIVIADRLYFKVDDETRAAFDAEGLPPFSYTKRSSGTAVMTQYRQAPERLFDEADEYLEWTRAAIGVARRAADRRPANGRRR